MIDTHSHLNFNAFKNDYAEVIKRSFDNGLKAIINVGAKFDSSQRAIELAEQFENLYASVGLHPIHVNDEDFNLENYQQLVKNEKVVAVGETGLDYAVFVREQGERLQKRASAVAESEGGLIQNVKISAQGGSASGGKNQNDPEQIPSELYGAGKSKFKIEELQESQKSIFKQFIDLAKEKELPMILHCRSDKENPLLAHEDMLKILREKNYFKGVAHCFTSTAEIAQEFLELGFYIGFTGVITFAPELEEVVKFVPLDRILLETDCPFMSPEPYRRQRCEPWYVKFTAEKITGIKNVNLEKVINQTTKNAKKLFKIPKIY